MLGDYNQYKTAMKWEKQTSYFGVADATPSTPIQTSKFSPFDSDFRAASSRGTPSSSGTSSSNKHTSRHQVAEPPPSASQQYVNKKDKTRTKLHPKHSSKMDASSQHQQRPASGLATVVKSNTKDSSRGGEVKKLSMAEGEVSQATNVLKSKPKKEKVRPYKPPVTGQHATTVSSLSTSSSHSKNALPTSSSSSSLFDFNASTVSSMSNSSLSIHRSSSNSSTTSTSSKLKQSVASERPSSVSSTPSASSRHGDSHVTPSHSNSVATSHKHSKKQASVLPTFGSSSIAGGKSQDVDSPRVVSIKRTNSLEIAKQQPSWDKGVASEMISPAVGETNKGESHNTVKAKKKRKKVKKAKEMMDRNPDEKKVDVGTTTSSSSLLVSSYTVASGIGHVTTAESHTTTKPPATHVKVEPTRSRPSDLKITTSLLATSIPAKAAAGAQEPMSAGLGVDEESQDTGDIHSMLQELMKPLNHSYSIVTPIPTPNKAKPFVFPTGGPVSVRGRHVYMYMLRIALL